MPVTRSATRAQTLPTFATDEALVTPITKRKRETIASIPSTSKAKRSKCASPEQPRHSESTLDSVPPRVPSLDRDDDQPMVDLALNFSFEDAKAHLINVDPRFVELFKRLKCKPFQHLEQVHPFRCVFGRKQCRGSSQLLNLKFPRAIDSVSFVLIEMYTSFDDFWIC